MLRHGVAVDPTRPITLLYSAPTSDALAFRDDVRELCRRHPQTRALFAVTRCGGGPDLYAGRIDSALLRASMADLRHAVAMICGPQPMIDAMRTLLRNEGLSPDQIRSELFEAAVAASTGHHPEAVPAADPSRTHAVKCARSGTVVRSAPGQTLLEAAEAGGVAMDSLCRAGLCGTCRTRVVGGEVDCESTVLGREDRALGYVLACVARPRTDCVIEA
jgi:ferredoxin-NADP reductase